jgi:hypothetical protein
VPLFIVHRDSNLEVLNAEGEVLTPTLDEMAHELPDPPSLRIEAGRAKHVKIDFEESGYFRDLLKGQRRTFAIRHLAFAGERQVFRLDDGG